MKKIVLCSVFAMLTAVAWAQQPTDSLRTNNPAQAVVDTLSLDPIELEAVYVYKVKMSEADKKAFQLLQNRVYRVYPYARIAADRLTALNNTMNKLPNRRDRKKYFKIVEQYLNTEFSDQLKKLSRKQGQILVKLIHRQTGITTYDIIKEHKSGWKAFWSNTTANLFDISLKMPYNPYEDNEDFLIETILERAFSNGRLIRQAPAHPVDLEQLTEYWQQKALAQQKNGTKAP